MCPDLCSWLIDEGSDVNRTSRLGSPLDCALSLDSVLYLRNRAAFLSNMIKEADIDFEDQKPSEIYELVSSVIRELVGRGAGLTVITHPHAQTRPLGMALLTYPENPKIIQLLLEGGALVTEEEIEIISQYLAKKEKQICLSSLPPGLSVLFLETTRKSVTNGALTAIQEVLTRLVGKEESDELLGSEHSASQQDETSWGLLEDELWQAAEHGILRIVQGIVPELQASENIRVESILAGGLCKALQSGHEEVVDYFLASGTNTNFKDEDGDTPVHVVLMPHLTLDADYINHQIKCLLDFGADLSIRNNDGEQAVHLAAISKHEGVLEAFVALIGDTHFQESVETFEPSLLQYAVMGGTDSAVRLIIQKYQRIVITDHQHLDGISLMGFAALRKTDVALRLLRQKDLSIEMLSKDGSSVMFHSATNKSDAPLNFLINSGAIETSTRSDGRNAIHKAAENKMGSKIATLLGAGHDPNVKDSNGLTPLHFVLLVSADDDDDPLMRESMLRLLLDDPRTEVNSQDVTGMTPIMACFQNLVIIPNRKLPGFQNHWYTYAQYLIKHKPSLSLTDQKGRTALHVLCQNGITENSFAFAKILVTLGASFIARDDFGISPFEHLFVSCVGPSFSTRFRQSKYFNRSEVLQYAIDSASGILNELLSGGLCPLSFALCARDQRAVDILLAKPEVDVDIRGSDKNRLTSLELAAAFGGCSIDTSRMLLSRTGNDIYTLDPVHGGTLLHWATTNPNDQTVLKELLQDKLVIEYLDRAGATALHTAIQCNNVAAVKLLLKASADANHASGTPKVLPLHQAVKIGQLRIVQKLIDHGADINASSIDTKSTALHYACQGGQWNLISFLIKSGARLNERNVSGNTPYLIAARFKHWHVVQNFSATTVDPELTNLRGLNAFHYAVLQGSIPTVQVLEKQNPSLIGDVIDSEGVKTGSTLSLAIDSDSVEMVERFWHAGAENLINDGGWGLSHFALPNTSNAVRNFLSTKGVDWNRDSAKCFSLPKNSSSFVRLCRPIHIASLNGFHPAITFLKENDLIPDINILTLGTEGYSPLHFAVLGNRSPTIKLLQDYGADLDMKSKPDERTPLHLAAEHGLTQVVVALLEAGCSPNLTDAHGMTPELLALENDHIAVVKILSQHLDRLEAKLDKTDEESSGLIVSATAGTKIWRLPLVKNPRTVDVMKDGNMLIYAVRGSVSSEEVRKYLGENEGEDIVCLGKPYRRRI